MLYKYSFFVISWLLFLLSSCGVHKSHTYLNAQNSYCTPAAVYHYEKEILPVKAIEGLDSVLLRKYSNKSLLVANAVGILQYLGELEKLDKSSLKYQENKNQIISHLALVSTEISSLAAELDCEGERADQVADFLTEKENRFIKKMTVVSITIGALAAVVTTILPNQTNDDLGKSIAIGGGAASAVLGVSTLFYNKKISFTHSRNLLTTIWNGSDTASVFPPSVWYILNEKAFSNDGQYSIQSNIRRRWESYYPDLSEDKKLQLLFFGGGGVYSREALRTRASMLNQVQASVKLINQDLQVLMMELILR